MRTAAHIPTLRNLVELASGPYLYAQVVHELTATA